MHKRFCFWKHFRSQRVNESKKLLEIAEKHLYSTFFISLDQTELEKVIFSQIWDFRTAC